MICPDFSRFMVEEAAHCLVPTALILPPPPISSPSVSALPAVSAASQIQQQQSHSQLQQQPQQQPQQQLQLQQPLRKYTLDDLRVSLCLHLVYDIWLKRLRWHDDAINIFRVRANIEEMRLRDAATACSSSMAAATATGGDDKVGAYTYFEQPPASAVEAVLNSLGTQGPDCTFIALKRALVGSEAVRADVLKVSKHATPLSSVTSVGSEQAQAQAQTQAQAQAQTQAQTPTQVQTQAQTNSLHPSATSSGPGPGPGPGSSNAGAATVGGLVAKTASQAKAAAAGSDDDDDDDST